MNIDRNFGKEFGIVNTDTPLRKVEDFIKINDFRDTFNKLNSLLPSVQSTVLHSQVRILFPYSFLNYNNYMYLFIEYGNVFYIHRLMIVNIRKIN